MRPCNKCLDNVWKFDTLDTGWIKATCQMCANEVEWEPKKKEKEAPTHCKGCDTKLTLRKAKITPKKLKKAYYFTASFVCRKCNKIYLDNQFKVINQTYAEQNT